jgi:small subunit ribosomal protein S16
MVKIRLARHGARNRPFFRVVALDERARLNGRALEFLGTYDPLANPAKIQLDAEKIEAWRAKGAQLSDAVRALLRRSRQQAAQS